MTPAFFMKQRGHALVSGTLTHIYFYFHFLFFIIFVLFLFFLLFMLVIIITKITKTIVKFVIYGDLKYSIYNAKLLVVS